MANLTGSLIRLNKDLPQKELYVEDACGKDHTLPISDIVSIMILSEVFDSSNNQVQYKVMITMKDGGCFKTGLSIFWVSLVC